jgi:hypothetical protein
VARWARVVLMGANFSLVCSSLPTVTLGLRMVCTITMAGVDELESCP